MERGSRACVNTVTRISRLLLQVAGTDPWVHPVPGQPAQAIDRLVFGSVSSTWWALDAVLITGGDVQRSEEGSNKRNEQNG